MGTKACPNEGFYTVRSLRAALKLMPDDAIVTVADCHLLTREVDGKEVALTRCRKLVKFRKGVFDHKRPVMNFTIDETAEDAICLFPDKSREIDECKSKELPLATGASSTVSTTSAPASTPSKARTARAKPTLSIRSSSRLRGTFRGFME